MKKYIPFIFFLSIFLNISSLFAINGKITDKMGNPVPSARIVFTNTKDYSNVYQTITDANGNYTLELPTFNVEKTDKQYTFFDIYPNPFYDGTVIPFFLNKSGNCFIYIYNLMGQKVRTISENMMTAGLHQIIWDGTTDNNQRVSPGFFIVYMYFEGRSTSQKIIMRANNNVAVFPNGIPYVPQMDTSKMLAYNVKITSDSTLPYSVGNYVVKDINNVNFTVFKKLALPYKVSGKYLSINNGDNTYDTIFINGINLGVGLPGTYPGEMAATSEDYRRWFNQMTDIGFNTIRTYTLHYPRFYEELAKHNLENLDKPLYLLQGVWLDEEKPNGNLFSFTYEFEKDVREIVDCMHGNNFIEERPGRASGNFNTNISQWILGYVIGREIHPYEVEKTNFLNYNTNFYDGATISMPPNSQPIECWLARHMDKMIIYERQKYQTERPISVSSWPTLDPIYHPTEHENNNPDYQSEEDKDSLDFGKLIIKDLPGGFFLTYHAYPYYPDFITDDPGYIESGFDAYGPNSYIVYITELWNHYHQNGRFPVIIGEYGVPSSWGNAHFANSGMNHGGHDYDKQGFYNARLLENIHNSYLAGGCLFAWIDEWFKQTWIVNPITCIPARRLMWHNLTSPEENFGLLTFVSDTVIYSDYQGFSTGNDIKSVNVAHDFQYYYLNVNLNDSLSLNDTLWVAIDTYKDTLGESISPNGKLLNHRSEFALRVTSNSAKLFVTRAYNTFGIYFYWWKDTLNDQKYQSIASNGAPWDLVKWKNGYKDNAIQDIGDLISCDSIFSIDSLSSLNTVIRNKYSYKIRIPWQLINFTDPSQVMVLHDDRSTSEVETEYSDGIAVTIFYRNTTFESENRYYWDWWGFVDNNSGEFIFPKYKEIKKKSFDIFKERIKLLDFKILNQ